MGALEGSSGLWRRAFGSGLGKGFSGVMGVVGVG